MGNHPDANSCSVDNPYYAVCTAGSHDLQGWVGPCRTAQDAAQKDADEHAQKSHAGVQQWTGVTHTIRATGYGRNSGVQP